MYNNQPKISLTKLRQSTWQKAIIVLKKELFIKDYDINERSYVIEKHSSKGKSLSRYEDEINFAHFVDLESVISFCYITKQ